MYNGIGLPTPRGSGTNGLIVRNYALVRPSNKDTLNYRTEEELAKLDVATNRKPNQEILAHQRKRTIELKCVELQEILEEKGYKADLIRTKVVNYRKTLLEHDERLELTKWNRTAAGTHQIAAAQQEKNSKLREAFGIPEYFVDGSSFVKPKEQIPKPEYKNQSAKQYELVRTPSPELVKMKKQKKNQDSSIDESKKKIKHKTKLKQSKK